MQLRSARLCLDCEELHEESQCPICASEAFVFLTRWIPVDDRRGRSRLVPRPASPPARVSRLVKGGAVGLAVLATARWLLRNPQAQSPNDRKDEPETDSTRIV
jgi:hypothetical protein